MDDILNIINSKFAINIALGIIGTVLLIIFFKKRKQNLIGSKSNNKAFDAQQAAYLAKKNQSKEELTIKERLELSWNFLYEIAEIVLNKFSPEDKIEIQELGKDLAKAGMKYEHIIDLGIKQKVSRVAALELNQDKSGQGRGV